MLARHFLFIGVPSLERIPKFIYNTEAKPKVKSAVEDLNLQLQQAAADFQNRHADATMLWFDAHSAFTNVRLPSFLSDNLMG